MGVHQHRILRQGRPLLHIVDNLGDGDGMVACFIHGGHLLLETGGRDYGALLAGFLEMVVHQHRQHLARAAVGLVVQLQDLQGQNENQKRHDRRFPADGSFVHIFTSWAPGAQGCRKRFPALESTLNASSNYTTFSPSCQLRPGRRRGGALCQNLVWSRRVYYFLL